MQTYETWEEVPNHTMVATADGCLWAIKAGDVSLVNATDNGLAIGWIVGGAHGPFLALV